MIIRILIEKIAARGMDRQMEWISILQTFRHGMPPHGGIGNRTGTTDDAAHRGRQCPRDNAIPKRFKQTGTIKK